jgi:preprotein translocase subunit SecG
MYQVIIVIHVLLGLGIIGLILMQQGKGADAGAAFGTGSAGSVFGAQGAASFLSRATAILATLFFLTSLGLAVINGHKGVAFDLMSSPDTQQDTSGLPDLGGAKGVDTTPAVPEIKSEEIPAVPEVKSIEQSAEPVSGVKIENTVVPKAEK